jgi:hypothetical protein
MGTVWASFTPDTTCDAAGDRGLGSGFVLLVLVDLMNHEGNSLWESEAPMERSWEGERDLGKG